MKSNSGKSFWTLSKNFQTFFHWLFYDPGMFSEVAIKELTTCQYQIFANYLVLADKFASVHKVFFFLPRILQVGSIFR